MVVEGEPLLCGLIMADPPVVAYEGPILANCAACLQLVVWIRGLVIKEGFPFTI